MTSTISQKYQPKGSKKKDALLDIEGKMREAWEKEKLHEVNAPAEYTVENREKYMTTFPYPYMNGKLHLGHAFSATKSEFKVRYMRLMGKNALFPFGFHCTGMPIAAAANKLKKEVANPDAPKVQWKILASMGIPESEIPNFTDAHFWLKYFPPKAHEDLKEFGVCVDWRRSFITTEANPYYDSFIRWQFETLKKKDKLSFGKRHTVYCTIDKQPCADHDRQSGEGIMPQQYTLIKLQILDPLPEAIQDLKGEKVFLVAATLRPETMYGQTNCFVLPDGEYGIYRMKTGELFVCAERAAKNMAYQELMPELGKFEAIKTVKGASLIGAALKAPLTKYEVVYALPMMTISMKKGTGIVTSVPSDAPDDFAALRDLQKKKEFREKQGVKEEWVKGFDPFPIIKTASFGDMAAVKLCEKLKIVSQKDTEKLKEAKDQAYLKGFNEGVMTVGICENEKVTVAKNKIRTYMIENGMAVDYYEPLETVISRSGDECVVALCDQWVIKYGEEGWKEQVLAHVKSNNFTAYNEVCYKSFLDTLDWLKEWACSRTFGLGTKLPWDTQFLIESLSDSTIYNAFYTVSHLLQGGVLDGSKPGPLGIKAEDIAQSDWDYIFLHKPYTAPSKIEEDKLKALRHEFEYWYPVDMRCSAKDLIKNHLTMMLYNHAAIWEEAGNKMMPRSFFCNGYIMVDGKKMSKQEGNFYTLRDVLSLFGTDATRLALACAGDLLEDANVEIAEIDNSLLKLFTLKDWIEKQLVTLPAGPLEKESPESYDLFDKIFLNDMISLCQETQNAYESMRFRDVVKFAFHEFQGAKEDYLIGKKLGKISWRAILQYVEWQLILIAPICPHIADYCWRELYLPKLKEIGEDAGKPTSVINARFPITEKHDQVLGRVSGYLKGTKRAMRLGLNKAIASKKGKKKGGKESKGKAAEVKKEEVKGEEKPGCEFGKCVIFVAKNYSEMQNKVLEVLNKIGLNEKNEINGDLLGELRKIFDKATLKNAVKFGQFCVERAKEVGKEAFEMVVPFDEKELLIKNIPYLSLDMLVSTIEIYEVKEACPYEQFKDSKLKGTPGNPEIFYLP